MYLIYISINVLFWLKGNMLHAGKSYWQTLEVDTPPDLKNNFTKSHNS
jgi:hypothetical protein